MILYISTSKLKKDTTIGSAVDDNIISPCIKIAQERYILPILGTKLSQKLDALILAGEVDDAGNEVYKTILNDYIQPSLVQFTFCEVAVFLRIRFSNNSITIPSSEQGSAASIADIKMLIDRSKAQATWHAERLINYLFTNTATIPQMHENVYPDLYPSRRNYNGGINLYQTLPLPNQLISYLQAIGARYLTYR